MLKLLKKYMDENPDKEVILCFASGICKKFYPCRTKTKFAPDFSYIVIQSIENIEIIPALSIERIKI